MRMIQGREESVPAPFALFCIPISDYSYCWMGITI